MHGRWKITRFVKEHTCLIQIEQNKHRNLSSKFISMSISHLVANDPEIPVSNIIQERVWYAQKFAIKRVFGSWETTFNILLKYLQAVQDLNPGTVYEFLCFSPCIDGFSYCRPLLQLLIRNPPKVGIGSLKTCENTLLKIATNVDTYIYLMKLDIEKWTLLHDGGYRYGIMTTNISEALNIVLKKARVLPLKALVKLIFNKLVKYFHQYREEAENYMHPFPTRIFDKFWGIEMKSREHKYAWSNLRSGFLVQATTSIHCE
ncbi:hypothetical protein M9H77_03652 [Catharanthus roseus]|uniref:Uncharacterized protein n=1 Tax=Catharanthus roseus TaxID=4058 RepID=A0ACC0CCB0_CATRO|nr:hypothetical protein M9H77_03652 [Catharanthus roseus]